MPKRETRSGTMMNPPPSPVSPLSVPPISPTRIPSIGFLGGSAFRAQALGVARRGHERVRERGGQHDDGILARDARHLRWPDGRVRGGLPQWLEDGPR